MQTIAELAVIVFLLGMFFGLPYQQAYRRRLALTEDNKNKPDQKKANPTPLDKSITSS